MSSDTIREALGTLQVDPDAPDAWVALKGAISELGAAEDRSEPAYLLASARERHRARGEWEAVVRLLQLEQELSSPEEKARLLRAEADVLHEQLLEEEAAEAAYWRVLDLNPDSAEATAAIEDIQGKRAKWKELVATYLGEAEGAPDDVYRSSMLMRAAEMEVRYGGEEADLKAVVARLEQALRLDAANTTAGLILERVLRRQERWDEVARVLERTLDRGDTREVRVMAGVRLARLCQRKLEDPARAALAFERVLAEEPRHEEAKSFLIEHYAGSEAWDELVTLYERELRAEDLASLERTGDMLQIAMLHWKKRDRIEDAEPWFERVRRLDPAQPLMLGFFREYAALVGDEARLMDVLTGAQRVMKEGPEKTQLGSELARLAEGQKNAHKAIEQYKTVLRQDPDNVEAREALKRLYKQTQGYNALVELLRQQLERTPASDYEARVAILREVAGVYRQFIKSDSALVSVLNQIVQLDHKLDEQDVLEMRELVGLYERLGRWRDLLTNQLKLAEITPDAEEKKALYRSAARRWLDQFSNVQNATEAYEALLRIAPEDVEARERLGELYRKRRAWPALYELYERELESSSGDARLNVLQEMAQLSAERLNRPDQAIRLYREIVDADPARGDALDALEKHAERHRDYASLANALERRVERTSDPAAKLAVLQRLGSVYGDHLNDGKAATQAWRRVLELSPGHHRALRVLRESYLESGDYDGLSELYASQKDWEGLAEVLSNAADRVKDPGAKVDLSYRAAAVYEGPLAQPDRAFRSYERVLSVTPEDGRAARALIPLYEQDEKWARLPALYELLLGQSESEAEKLEYLQKLVEVTGHKLGDRKVAAAHARSAYALAPSSEAAFDLVEAASRAAGAWQELAETLEARLNSIKGVPPEPVKKGKGGRKRKKTGDAEPQASGSPSERRRLRLRLAALYDGELSRTDAAVATYKELLEEDPADRTATQELEAILRRTDARDDLRWLLDLRVQHTPSDDDRVAILREWAETEQILFGDPERAVALYQRVLEIAPSDESTLRVLSNLLLASGDAAAAAEVLDRHRQLATGEEKAQIEVRLAQLYLDRLEREGDALDAAVRALDAGDTSGEALAVLQRLVERPATRGAAAQILAARYADAGDARREAQALSALLEQKSDRVERLDLYRRIADVQEQKLGAYGTALDALLRAVREYPDELELWERAERLAVHAGRPTDLADTYREVLRASLPHALVVDLCERAAHLHEDRLGDPIGATPYLEKVLEIEPGNERAFTKLKDILTAAERWGELEGLYDRAAMATNDLARRTELLIEVALICEEITEEPAKAARYYERILDSDPAHDGALRALDRLYQRQERHEDLASLIERRLGLAAGEELLELKLRLARIQLERLHQPEGAIAHVEDILNERPNEYDARELCERLLEIGSLRQRAARVLETVYETRDEIRDLVRVLEIRLERYQQLPEPADPELEGERRDLLRRIATLRDERLHDDESTLETLALLVPADPLDVDARTRLLEVGRRLGRHERVAAVLEQSAERADTPGLKGEILMKVAGIYAGVVGDRDRAEAVYRRVLELDPNEVDLVLPAARALEQIYTETGRYEQLVRALREQVRLEQDPEVRKRLLGRLGSICQSELGDLDGAIAAFKTRVEEDPVDTEALAALDELYQKTERFPQLVETLEKRRDLAEAPALRRELLMRLARILAEKLDRLPPAIDAWRTIVEEHGPDVEVLEALEALYARAERWDELGDTYEQHLDVVSTDQERLELLAKLGELRRERQNDTAGALEVFRRALGIDSRHATSRDALLRMLASDDLLARREAAEVLRPIFEIDGDHQQLLRVLEIEADLLDDPLSRLDVLAKAIGVAEQSQDPERAFGYAKRALREAAGHTDLEPWLEHVDRLAAATGKYGEQVELLQAVAPEIFDGDVQLAVLLKIADLGRHRLADRDLAREHYQKALEVRSDDRRALGALESLYDEAGDAASLLGILDRQVDVAESDSEKKQLMFRRARLLAEVLEDRPRAIEAYERILDLGLDPSAIEALEALYTQEERHSDLVELYQRQIDGDVGNPVLLRVMMARVFATRLADVPRALDELEAALESDRHNETAIAELEKLLAEGSDPEVRARAASLLEPIYLARADFTKVMATIEARLAASQDPQERRELLRRLAQLHEEQAEDYPRALETTAKLLDEDPSDPETVGELERLAKVAGAEQRLAEIYAKVLEAVSVDEPWSAKLAERAGELFEGLGESERALACYRRALAFDPERRELFTAVDRLLERVGRHEERVELYRQALDHRFDAADRLALLHKMAELQTGPLAVPEQAIESYRAALEVDERDRRSLDALTDLYVAQQRYADLDELYQRRAELADTDEEAAGFRLKLSRLLRGPLSDTARAIDQLEEIVQRLPGHADALKELEQLRENEAERARVVEILRPLYEQADDWRKLIRLNEDRFELAPDPLEKVAVLRETARLWEARGNDPVRARRALSVAVELEPDDMDVRAEYERLVQQTEAWTELSEIYESVLRDKPDLASKRDLLATLARVHDQHRDDPRSALHAYERLHEAEPSELEALEKLDQLATLLSDWPVLVRALTAKAELLLDGEERASTWRRVGEVRRDMLDQRPGAIEAYERALEDDPSSAFTVDCLIELYEGGANAERLVELYQRRVELSDDEDVDLKYELLKQSAELFEGQLNDAHRAIEAYHQALSVKPADAVALKALNRLYRAERLWSDLLDNLKEQAAHAASAEERAEYRNEIGAVLADELHGYDEALEAYRQVFEDSPANERASAAVRRIAKEHEELRVAVAEILVPLLRAQQRHEDLIDVLELRLSVESEPHDRAETLRQIADIFEHSMGDAGKAHQSLLRALGEVPEDSELHDRIERLSEPDRWRAYADVLSDRASSTFDPDAGSELYRRLGKIAEEKLSDQARAIDAYQRAVELAGDRPELLAALDKLYQRVGDKRQLADVLERRVVVADPGSEQGELYFRLAELQIHEFGEAGNGLLSLRSALEQVPDHEGATAELEKLTERRDLFEEAAEVLEGVYRSRGRTDKLAALYEKRVGFADTPGERIDMRRSLARVLEEDVGDPKAAQRVLEQGLAEDPSDPALLDEIERLAAITGEFQQAAGALATAVDQKPDLLPDTARELCVRSARWYRDRANDAEAAEKALTRALDFDPSSDEVLADLEALQKAPGRERDLITTLRRRAALQFDPDARNDHFRTAKELADQLGDTALAEQLLRETLTHDDTNLWALSELTKLREAAGDYQETFRLLIQRSELRAQGDVVRELRQRAAAIALDHLGKVDTAIDLYQQLFEDEPTDAEAAAALRRLYERSERFDDLARLIERQVDLAESTEERSKLRLELSRMNVDKFDAIDTAIELLRDLLLDDPTNAEAVLALSDAYEKTGRDEDLAELLNDQLEAAKSRGDVEAELKLQVRLGEVYDARLGDRAKAIATYRAVLERSPEHRPALEATARLLQSEEKHGEAAQVLERLLAISDGAGATAVAIALADEYDKLGDANQAVTALERGLTFDERNEELRKRLRTRYEAAESWQGLAGLLAGDADLVEAPREKLNLLRQAAQIHSRKLGDHVTAAELLDKASHIVPGDRQVLLELCDEYSASGRGKQAAEVLERIVESYGGKRSKELAEIHRRLADAYLADGEKQRAIEELDKAFRIEPGNVTVLKNLGQIALETDDLPRAQKMFRALLLQRLDDSSPITKGEAFFNLGEVHRRLGEKTKAIQMYERALQQDQSLQQAKDRLTELKT